MKYIRRFLYYLIYKREWKWLQKFINCLCDIEMKFRAYNRFNEYILHGFHDLGGIPHGMYCYDSGIVCPYWDYSRIAELVYGSQLYGYCYYLGESDYNWDTQLLWDQCKECGIDEIDEDDLRHEI